MMKKILTWFLLIFTMLLVGCTEEDKITLPDLTGKSRDEITETLEKSNISYTFKFAEKISLGEFILMGRGEEHTGGRNRPSIVSDAFEAVIAAMYLDGGIDVVKPYILGFIKEAVKREASFKDNKSLLQEEIQKEKGNTLSYEEIGEFGPDHDKTFKFVVKLNDKVVGKGEGRTKKDAEQAAAGDALTTMKICRIPAFHFLYPIRVAPTNVLSATRRPFRAR